MIDNILAMSPVALAFTIVVIAVLFIALIVIITLYSVYGKKLEQAKHIEFDNEEHERKKQENRSDLSEKINDNKDK